MTGAGSIFGLLLLASVIYLYRRTRGPVGKGATMENAWDHWMRGKDRLPEDGRRIVELVQGRFTDKALESLRRELLAVEEKSRGAPDPLVPLRAAIMDAVDTSLLNEALSKLDGNVKKKLQTQLGDLYTDEIFSWSYLTSSLTLRILRWYSSRKYDDGGENDWFSCYTKIAQDRTRNIIDTFHCLEDGHRARAKIQTLIREAYDERGREKVQQYFLKAPRKTPVRYPKEAASGEPDRWTW